MKQIPAELSAHIRERVTSIATCWKITRTDGVIYGFTDHDRDLQVSDGQTVTIYRAATGYTRSAVANKADLSVDNLDMAGFFDSAAITERDLRAGLWDNAEIKIFQVNWRRPGDGIIPLRKGTIGEVGISDGQYTAEMRGLTQPLQQTIGEVYAPTCTADLGDARCGVDLSAFTESATVTSVIDAQTLEVSGLSAASDYYNAGLATFTAGASQGVKMEVARWDAVSGRLTLFQPVLFEVAAGDTLDVYPGCDKRLATCRDRFNNVRRFRGFPSVPTPDSIVRIPDAG